MCWAAFLDGGLARDDLTSVAGVKGCVSRVRVGSEGGWGLGVYHA